MKSEFIEYFKKIGLSDILQDRITVIYEYYQKILNNEISKIYVSEYLKEDGARMYEGLWFFSDKYTMEAKNFVSEDDFDMTVIDKRIQYWNVKKKDYDFEKATEKSRLSIYFTIDTGMSCDLKASKENCDYLKEIFFKYVVPNLKK
jgi:hypothetical protein